jgi:HEAT repeat protein
LSRDRPAEARALDAYRMRGFEGQREYVAGLEARADEQAVSLLVECLCDESPHLRDLAEQAVRRMGPDRAPALRPLLHHGLWFTRAAVARILGGFADREALADLIALAADTNRHTSGAACDAVVGLAAALDPETVARALLAAPEAARQAVLAHAASAAPALCAEVERQRAAERRDTVPPPEES